VQVRPMPSSLLWPSATRAGLGALVLAASVVTAQAQSAPAPGAPPPAASQAPGTYKNVQILKDMSPAQLHDTMVFFAAVTGGNCQGCHVRGTDGELAFEKDDNDHKTTARTMIAMVRAINTQHFKGEERVTCATCHQARRTPNPLPPLALMLTPDQLAAQPPPQGRGGPGGPGGLGGQGAPGAGGPPAAGEPPAGADAPPAAGQQPPAGGRAQGPGGQAAPGGGRGPQRPTETVDQVLDKYLQALGGREALATLKTRTRKGTVTNRGHQTATVTIEDTAAGQVRTSIDGQPAPATRAFDGKAAWGQTGTRVRDFEGVESTNISLAADLALPTGIKDAYNALAVQNYGRIAGHQVITMQGRRSGGVTEQLLFDRESGLLARRIIRLKTPMGELPVQIDYSDYRPVGGVQTPFEMHITDWESVSAMKFSEVVFNQPVDAARFARPTSPAGR